MERFEWDDAKAASNLRKHRVAFTEAASVFEDEFAIFEADPLHSEEEIRATVTGLSARSRVLLVVYVERRERVRLISARKATPQERRMYESQFDSFA
jgi:uncharacterized DUF497 family protein